MHKTNFIKNLIEIYKNPPPNPREKLNKMIEKIINYDVEIAEISQSSGATHLLNNLNLEFWENNQNSFFVISSF